MAAADLICQQSASAAHIPNPAQYIAWVSTNQDDAYCRVHGAHGKRANACNGAAGLGSAGPWYRMDDLPSIDIAQNSLLAYPYAGYVPHPIEFDEFGAPLLSDDIFGSTYFTATNAYGTLDTSDTTCADWTSSDNTMQVTLGQAYHTFLWGGDGFGWACCQTQHLACLQVGPHGPAFARIHASSPHLAFLTSTSGTGDLSSWPEAAGATSIDAGNAICRAHARSANFPLPNTYCAWLSTSTSNAIDSLVFDGPWYRPDGVRVAASKNALTRGTVEAPIQITEQFASVPFEQLWTGTNRFGTLASINCTNWQTNSNSTGGATGVTDAADYFWTSFDGGMGCGQTGRLYCFADNDALFVNGFDD